ncbi:hypothetical protein [Caudoviricetes sp.]|nr:hypothetical protein [Caudoviricetes sp.]
MQCNINSIPLPPTYPISIFSYYYILMHYFGAYMLVSTYLRTILVH